MALSNLSIDYAERVYNALLSLYPVRFRVRFAPEMLQLFRDCAHDALEKGQIAVVAAFALRLIQDLCISIIRERTREAITLDGRHPLIRVVDLLLIPGMIVINLLVLGPFLTICLGGERIPAEQFAMTSAFFSVMIGILAFASSVVITRLRPTVRLWVKLSA
jgi:hypothetical protein